MMLKLSPGSCPPNPCTPCQRTRSPPSAGRCCRPQHPNRSRNPKHPHHQILLAILTALTDDLRHNFFFKAAAIIHMILNNLDPAVAQFPQELVTYGGNGQVGPRSLLSVSRSRLVSNISANANVKKVKSLMVAMVR